MEKKYNERSLNSKETEFFLIKVNAAKLGERIITHFKLSGIDELKRFLGSSEREELNERKLIKLYKNNDIPNKILTHAEKVEIQIMYSNDVLKKIEDRKKIEKISMKKEVSNLASECELRILKTKDLSEITIKQKNKLISTRTKIESIFKKKSYLSSEEIETLELINSKLKIELNKSNHTNKTEKSRLTRSNELSKEYLNRMKEAERKQEEEIIARINARKNAEVQNNIKNNESIKNESVLIVAYREDFNSEKSRFVLSVLHGNNIKISFYKGIIKLINEDGTFNEVEFDTIKNIMNFKVDSIYIELDLNTDGKIIDLLIKQTSSKETQNKILDCISVLYYINTFYNEKEKIEVSYDEVALLPTKSIQNSSNNISTIYLSNNQNNKIKTIKIKKGKRGIIGSFLIRGHWRRQKYNDGVKIIWIEPFWKGKGKAKTKIYKISKTD